MDLLNITKWIVIIVMGALYLLWAMQFVSNDFYEKYKVFY